MEKFQQQLNIPKQRVAVLIGVKGETKRELEKKTKTELKISSDGEVTISSIDSFDSWVARNVIKAIGRGFSPEHALLLLKEDYGFELIELKDWAKNENNMMRLKGRVIGEGGKSRIVIEEITESFISVYGKTICIIAKNLRIPIVRHAVEMLLSGSMHATVYKMLERENKKWRREELVGEI